MIEEVLSKVIVDNIGKKDFKFKIRELVGFLIKSGLYDYGVKDIINKIKPIKKIGDEIDKKSYKASGIRLGNKMLKTLAMSVLDLIQDKVAGLKGKNFLIYLMYNAKLFGLSIPVGYVINRKNYEGVTKKEEEEEPKLDL